MAAGGWSHDSPEPAFDEKNEGLRRPVCDLILLAFHLVISVLMWVVPMFYDRLNCKANANTVLSQA